MSPISRRDLLAGAAGALLLPFGATARPVEQRPRAIAFEHLHTGEQLSLVYKQAGHYLPDALRAIDRVLRDHYSDEVHPIDPRLIDLLADLREATGSAAPFRVISGYRSPATNERLRAQGRGVGKRSMHLLGRAIDVRLVDVDSAVLRDCALALARGGVGYYRRSDFVHVDTGRVRRW